MQNLLSYRGRMTQQEFMAKAQEIEHIILKRGAKKAAPVITTTFSVEQGAMGPIMDAEFWLPWIKKSKLLSGFVWKPPISADQCS